MNRIPMIEGLKRYNRLNMAPFSMPGHKKGRAFNNEMMELTLNSDITEVDGLDNLQNPQGIIKDAQELLKECYGSQSSYFLINGSTSGNLTMIFAAFQEGDKVLIERNCHKSIYNGILLRKLNPVLLKNEISEVLNAPLGIDVDHLFEVIEQEKDIKGIVLTYPNYFGIGVRLEKIVEKCKKNGIKVLIDSAHGAHFGFNENLPENPLKYNVDMVVMSAHKTLPALTQTAYLHINKEEYKEKVEFYLRVFNSTSPSYIFMATLDYSRYYLQEKAQEEYNLLISRINNLKKNVGKSPYLKVLEKEDLGDKWVFDPTKIVITQQNKYKAEDLLNILYNKGIQCEMSLGRSVVLIATPFNIQEDFDRLEKAVLEIELVEQDSSKDNNSFLNIKDGEIIEPCRILQMQTAEADIEKIENMIAAENIIPYPPGIPFIIMGEKISRQKKDKLIELVGTGIDIIGVECRKIKVVLKDTIKDKDR